MVFLSSVESNSASPAKGRGEPAFRHDVHKVRAYFDRDRELFNGPIKVMLLILPTLKWLIADDGVCPTTTLVARMPSSKGATEMDLFDLQDTVGRHLRKGRKPPPRNKDGYQSWAKALAILSRSNKGLDHLSFDKVAVELV